MTINYAEKYSDKIGAAIVQGNLTGRLDTEDVTFDGARSIKVPVIRTPGMTNYNRESGFGQGNLSLDYDTYTLGFDRGQSILVDEMDEDETAQALRAENLTQRFLDTQIIPEMDAYRFSKLATLGKDNSTVVELDLTEKSSEEVFRLLKTDIDKARKYGARNQVCYVSTEVMSAIEETKLFKGTISISDGSEMISTRVTNINGVEVVEVYDEDRFYDKFDFTQGFVPAEGSRKLNWLVVSKPAVIATVKLSLIRIIKKEDNQLADGYLYQCRIYQDIFTRETHKDGVRGTYGLE